MLSVRSCCSSSTTHDSPQKRRTSSDRRDRGDMEATGETEARRRRAGGETQTEARQQTQTRWRRDGRWRRETGARWRRRRGWRRRVARAARLWLLTLTLTLTRVRSCGFSRRSHSEHPALEVSRRTCGSVRRHHWRVVRRPASSPTRLRARWPTARFDRATSPAARRHSSVPPPPPCSRLERSTGPGSGSSRTSRERRRS